MAYHLIPFVAGAVVGGLAVYLFRDEQLREDLRHSAGSLSRRTRETASEVSGKVTQGLTRVRGSMPGRSQAAASSTAADQTDAETTTPKPRTPARRTATRKSPTRATVRKRAEQAAEAETSERPEDT